MKKANNGIKFLGTAGARFVMIKQLRASGGLWVHKDGANVLIDPGPGCIVRCASSRPKLDPTKLDAIILTHRHLDHCNDINVMIEAMTEGGFKKRGVVFLPEDAVASDSVLLKHTQTMPEKIEIIKGNKEYSVGKLKFSTTFRLKHSVETYGLKFYFKNKVVALLSDTLFFDGLIEEFQSDILIINVVFYEPRAGIEHLNFQDTKQIIRKIHPEQAIITHFGMGMLRHKPHLLAEELTKELDINALSAYDGMTLELD